MKHIEIRKVSQDTTTPSKGAINYKVGGGVRFVINDSIPDGKYTCNDEELRDLMGWLSAVKHIIETRGCKLADEDGAIYLSIDSFYTLKEYLDPHIVIGYGPR